MNGAGATSSRKARWRHCAAVGALILAMPLTSFASTVSYTYDELGRVLTAIFADGSAVTYSYDPAGNRTQLVIGDAPNQAPTAVSDSITVTFNTAMTFDPRTNDTDPDTDPLTITVKTNGAHGSVSINSGTSLTYAPTTGYSGADSFTYTISDGEGGISTATVSVTVNAANQPPTAVNDAITTLINTAKNFDPRTNDSDPESGTLAITAKTNGSNGTVAINSGTSLTYTPTTGFTGSDSFTYTISDPAAATATATVSVTVNNSVADGTVLYTKSTSGSFTYTIPINVAYVDIEGWGGGATALWEDLGEFGTYSEGGGGGGYFRKRIGVTTGQTISGSVASGGVSGATTVTSPALTANTSAQDSGVGGTASGGDVNTAGNSCCSGNILYGGGSYLGGANQTTTNANGNAPGGGGAGYIGQGAAGRIRITARTSP